MIRWAEQRDSSSIVEMLERVDELFFPPLSKRKVSIRDRVKEVMDNGSSNYLLFEEDGVPMAVVGYTVGKGEREGAYMNVLCVLPQFQGKGIGSRLLDEFEGRLSGMGVESVWACTWSTNVRALALYTKRGYSIERVIEHHRAKNVHTVVLSKQLGADGDV
ncbi:MAG: GNAT family N-acetyltransferase [Methermicoccaceae archaeon]